ncbi:glycosyltransferase family 31 protein [Pseudocercospora fijiensis CIRAD86]|uniref:Glycosyltransferase family 31 protein n=1 Tax=Pseudocercospora fijiensis (strain CIRAD86) TaxID=383855 RepID=N1QD02_PSEFD|nr:glycosyltransferase family 31 protein [Pseudocercospora fijiensis CIRAD86]EME89528.1 glycosyltransferase family 31 protein [Pseudocercospora fijiensis CIRAD86]
MLLGLPRSTKAAIFVTLSFSFLLFLHLIGSFPALPIKWNTAQHPTQVPAHGQGEASNAADKADLLSISESLPCHELQGGDDVLVVMRTGATEIQDKLPAHLNTTFLCYKNLVIFSDYEEDFRGWKVHDVLANVDDDIKTTNDDWTHYQRILKLGRSGLDKSELSGNNSYDSGPFGKNENAGWRLDKWKFLPMMNSTYTMYPHLDWYVFVEPDTYVVWSNLIQWLGELDPTEPLYFGSETQIGNDIFAHGGSAFVLSRPALEIGVESYRTRKSEWHDYTAGHWAGDCILGKALHDNGVELTWSWPMFQGGNPALMDWKESKPERKLWCLPALSYHHLSPDELRELFQFEQDWIREKHLGTSGHPFFGDSGDSPILHHRDVFKQFVLPNFSSTREYWNNTAEEHLPETEGTHRTLGHCKTLCEADSTCLQYALGPDGCFIGHEPRLGRSHAGSESGWMHARIKDWAKDLDHCGESQGWSVS